MKRFNQSSRREIAMAIFYKFCFCTLFWPPRLCSVVPRRVVAPLHSYQQPHHGWNHRETEQNFSFKRNQAQNGGRSMRTKHPLTFLFSFIFLEEALCWVGPRGPMFILPSCDLQKFDPMQSTSWNTLIIGSRGLSYCYWGSDEVSVAGLLMLHK